jgi:SAM-dependent methyltransferase
MTDVDGGSVPGFEGVLDRFESIVSKQTPLTAGRYDEDYFASRWRAGGNRYDLQTRRRLEAHNPRLIKEVFAPARVLDVGCGPGFLMLFLLELGVDVAGVDFAPASKTLAPAAVRDRITIADATDSHVPDRAFDLVVCREVIEHLSLLQIRRAVAELCRVSSRFVYVTTRSHPTPQHLLDVTTDFETDPTHITLMTMDLLRLLFVLEGFRRRRDLETRMDWAGKRRVLVYARDAG